MHKNLLHCGNCIINEYWVMYPVISSYLYHQKQAILMKAWNKHRFFISLY